MAALQPIQRRLLAYVPASPHASGIVFEESKGT